jgi:hypothetical protein
LLRQGFDTGFRNGFAIHNGNVLRHHAGCASGKNGGYSGQDKLFLHSVSFGAF